MINKRNQPLAQSKIDQLYTQQDHACYVCGGALTRTMDDIVYSNPKHSFENTLCVICPKCYLGTHPVTGLLEHTTVGPHNGLLPFSDLLYGFDKAIVYASLFHNGYIDNDYNPTRKAKQRKLCFPINGDTYWFELKVMEEIWEDIQWAILPNVEYKLNQAQIVARIVTEHWAKKYMSLSYLPRNWWMMEGLEQLQDKMYSECLIAYELLKVYRWEDIYYVITDKSGDWADSLAVMNLQTLYARRKRNRIADEEYQKTLPPREPAKDTLHLPIRKPLGGKPSKFSKLRD